MARSESFSMGSQLESLDAVEDPVMTHGELDKAGLERSRVVDHTMHLLTLKVFSFLHALLCNNSLYTLDGNKPLELDAAK